MLCCLLNIQTDNISQSSEMKTEKNVKSENKKTRQKETKEKDSKTTKKVTNIRGGNKAIF